MPRPYLIVLSRGAEVWRRKEELDLTSPQTVPDVVFQTYAIVQQIVVRLDGIDRRLDAMDRRMDRMDSRMDRMESRMDKIEERINGNFVWTTGIILTTWITLMVTILMKM